MINAAVIQGEVLEVQEDGLVLPCWEYNAKTRTSSQGKIKIVTNKADEYVAGDKVRVRGKLHDHGYLEASAIEDAADDRNYTVAKIVAPIQRKRHFGANDGQRMFSTVTLRHGEGDDARYFDAIGFQDLAVLFKNATRGSIAEVIGRFRKRVGFTRRDGSKGEGIDILGDNERTKILQAAKLDDPFSDWADTPDEFDGDGGASENLSDEIPF